MNSLIILAVFCVFFVQSFVLLCDIVFFQLHKRHKEVTKAPKPVLILLYYRGMCDSFILAKVEYITIADGLRVQYNGQSQKARI
jgi:hypothetical protein